MRKAINHLAIALLTAAVASPACHAATIETAASYPSRPIRFIVGFAPGGSADFVARLVGHKLGEAWRQQVVIDNRPGAGGNLSAEIAARAAPDGYTLYMTSAALVVNVSLYRKVGYDPVRDFEPVTLLASTQNVLVANPSVPAKSVADLIALARRNPGRINYASTGNGTSGHLAMELLKSVAHIDMTHVPYKAVGQAQVDLIAGEVTFWFPTIAGALPHIKAGRMNALAVSGAVRSPGLPDVPTVAESGFPGFEASTWYPVLAPARTPRPIVEKASRQLAGVVKTREVRDPLVESGVEPVGSTSAELASRINSELGKWAKLIEVLGVKLD